MNKKIILNSDNPYFSRMDSVSNLYNRCFEYLDSNFSTEINNNPISKVWELIVCDIFLDKELSLRTSQNKGGPDFIIDDYPIEGKVTCIECVAPEPGKDITEPIPEDDFITLRITSSITEKIKQVDRWVAATGIDEFYHVLAINTSKLRKRRVNLQNIFGNCVSSFVKSPGGIEYEEVFIKNEIMKYRSSNIITVGDYGMNHILGHYFHGILLSNDMPLFSTTVPPFQVESLTELNLESIFRS